MASDDFIYRSQDVNYLGFLEAQLRDLQGIHTLAYELIQNADDVQEGEAGAQPTWITFDITDEALVVSNDGVFRPVDFARMQDLSGGGKREETNTTGAFGLGFLAVYQVTDRPEIFSSGRHWIIRPEAPQAQRIQERRVETAGTRFHLPWAFDERSPVRRALRLPAIETGQLDSFTNVLAEALPLAALFLRRLQRLEVRRSGVLVRRIERELVSAGELRLMDESGHVSRWLLLDGDFAAEAQQLRAQYPWQIEPKRQSDLRLALPAEEILQQGRLFAGLPSETTSPLPFYINAAFFPTTDRKRIHLDSGYQGEWNEAALAGAAAVVAGNAGRLQQALSPLDFWQLLAQLAETGRMAEQGDLPAIFAVFWKVVAPLLSQDPVVFTLEGKWRMPAETRLWVRPLSGMMGEVLRGLELSIVHPDLASYFPLMRRAEVGTPPLAVADIAAALLQAGLGKPTLLAGAPPFLRSFEALQALWQLVDPLLEVAPAARDRALATLAPCALVLTEGLVLERLDRVYRGGAEARMLFPEVPWLHDLAPEDAFPGRYVPEFGVRQATALLAATPVDQLEADWRLGRLDLQRLFRWFESRQIEIFGDDPALAGVIRRLPLGPVAGDLRPLAELYIPGGFVDPLGAAGVVELEALGGRREFLWDLGMEELSFDSYLYDQMPRALLQNPDLPSDARHQLLQLLAERLGAFRDDEELQERLSELPLVPCMDGSFRAARSAYSQREARSLLGERAQIAEPAANQAISSLQRWLGVREEPGAAELVAALMEIGDQAGAGGTADSATLDMVGRIWRQLAVLLAEGKAMAATLTPLRERPVYPVPGGVLRRPDMFLFGDDPELVARFPALSSYLLSSGDEAAAAARAAGVQSLSQVAQVQLVSPTNMVPAVAIAERLNERTLLIRRILTVELPDEGRRAALALLDSLEILSAPVLNIQWHLPLAGEWLSSQPETVRAWLDRGAGVLYVTSDDAAPWLAIARELAQAFSGERLAGGLAIAMKEVLAARTFAGARQILDELGYPPSSH